ASAGNREIARLRSSPENRDALSLRTIDIITCNFLTSHLKAQKNASLWVEKPPQLNGFVPLFWYPLSRPSEHGRFPRRLSNKKRKRFGHANCDRSVRRSESASCRAGPACARDLPGLRVDSQCEECVRRQRDPVQAMR